MTRDEPLHVSPTAMTRRALIRAAAGTALSAPFVRPSYAARSLRVSSYGGICEQSYRTYVYPAFTKATGIAVESIPQPEGLAFLLQLAQANRNGSVPMDLALFATMDVLRARPMQLLRSFDPKRISTLDQVPDRYLSHGPGGLDGVGVMAWYTSLVIDTEVHPQLPDSWQVFWQKSDQPMWGVSGAGGLSVLFEITAQLFAGGIQALDSHEGIDATIAHMALAKPNIQLWWEDEGTMQTALQNQEVVGGTYFNDDARTLARQGMKLASIFPKEGAVEDYGCWCQPSASTKLDEAYEFIRFSCTPEAQRLIALHEGSAPVMEASKLGLPPGALDGIKPAGPTIATNSKARTRNLEYMTAKFNKMITGA